MWAAGLLVLFGAAEYFGIVAPAGLITALLGIMGAGIRLAK